MLKPGRSGADTLTPQPFPSPYPVILGWGGHCDSERRAERKVDLEMSGLHTGGRSVSGCKGSLQRTDGALGPAGQLRGPAPAQPSGSKQT